MSGSGPRPKGLLVAFEGNDGVGKTTQLGLLHDELVRRGVPAVRSKEPTDGPWGRKLRASAHAGRLPPDEELQAFLSDRREHVEKLIAPSLAQGTVVLLDRYYFSTAAYQGARGMDPAALLAENEAFAPRPALLVLLELTPEESVARLRARGDTAGNEFERIENLRRTAEVFASLQGEYLLRLDARRTRESLAGEILEAVLRRLDP